MRLFFVPTVPIRSARTTAGLVKSRLFCVEVLERSSALVSSFSLKVRRTRIARGIYTTDSHKEAQKPRKLRETFCTFCAFVWPADRGLGSHGHVLHVRGVGEELNAGVNLENGIEPGDFEYSRDGFVHVH